MEIKTLRQAVNEIKKFATTGESENIKDAGQFARVIADALESLSFKLEAIEREMGPSNAFIDPNDVNNRLR